MIKTILNSLHKNLVIRITLPILIPILALGAILYFYVLTTISEFAKEQIDSDLTSLSRRSNNICNINFNNLLLSGLADDEDALIIQKGLTLGQIEDFFTQENLKGYVFDQTHKKILYQTDLPALPEKLTVEHSEFKKTIFINLDTDQFYLHFTDFLPWDWGILVLKNADVYSGLIIKVQRVYLFTIGSLILFGFLMIFFIFQSISKPTKAIVATIQKNEKPVYKGIDVFEFLSNTIAAMMDSIRQNEEKYRMIVENSTHMIWEMDPDGRFTFISPTVFNILGYHPDELMGKTPMVYMDDEEAIFFEQMIQAMQKNHIPIEDLVNTVIHKNGQRVFFETTGIPFFDANKNFIGYRGINRDITHRIHTEREKIEARKIAAEQAQHALVGQIAGKMAHDFNNILGIIMGNSELALMDCTDPELQAIFQIIFDQTQRGKNLTKNLVAFAKDQEPKQEFFDINKIVELVLNLMKKDLDQIKLVTQFDYNIPELLADPGMIEHSLVNMIQNCIHALSLKTDPEIYIQTFCRENNVYIIVKDNGCGIPAEHLNDIFSPSFTLKGTKDITGSYKAGIKGTGYGMSNIKKYIQQHNGSIDVISEFGLYTTITITLPLIQKELSDTEKQQISNSICYTHKKILVVEDEQPISDVQQKILSQTPCYHQVDVADNGKDAIQLFERKPYDLISLDYMLPGTLNGMDIYNHIRKKNTAIPILFISGNIEFLESIKNLKKNDSNIDHLSKPCQNTDYIHAINRLFLIVSHTRKRSAL
ncbi:MAG: PAS domain S-box protein [Pseudomonadota bacterium]